MQSPFGNVKGDHWLKKWIIKLAKAEAVSMGGAVVVAIKNRVKVEDTLSGVQEWIIVEIN